MPPPTLPVPHSVKCFTNEPFELSRFNEAVRAYQFYSISTQASLSLLNVVQQVGGLSYGGDNESSRRGGGACRSTETRIESSSSRLGSHCDRR